MARKKDRTGWLLGGAAVVLGAAGYHYLKKGMGKANDAPGIPNIVEKPIDNVIDALEGQFGASWMTKGRDALTAFISLKMPTMTAVMDAIHEAIEQPSVGGITGPQISRQQVRTKAAEILRRRGIS